MRDITHISGDNIARRSMMLLEKGLSATLIKVDILDFIDTYRFKFNSCPTISEISRRLKIPYNSTHRYIQEFKKHDIVKLTPNTPSRGKKVFVEINHDFKKEFIVFEILHK